MELIDRGLELLYRRLGWRIIIAYQAFAYAGIGVLGGGLVALLIRINRISPGDAIGVSAVLFGWVLAAYVLSTIGIVRTSRTITAWLEGGRHPSEAEGAWKAALRLPRTTILWNTGVMLVLLPLAVGGTGAIINLQIRGIAFVAVGYLCGLLTLTSGSLYTAQLASRPIVADVAASLEHRSAWPVGVSLAVKLRAAVIPIVAACVGWGVAFGLKPGSGLDSGLWVLLVALATALVVSFPVALLLAYSILRPLDDLLGATERLKRGDFATRVPELSADEYGELARSFNEAMEGLAEREQLATENRQLLGQVRASRARIVAASDAERRRVERNIHDGAQQQLVGLAVKLRLLEDRVAGDNELRPAIAQLGARLKDALDDLRELARGLHPSVLTTDGLAPALEQLASHASVPITIRTTDERFDGAVESTVYFVVSEALANVAKYAHATHATVSVEHADSRLLIQVTDDGVGGAHLQAGSGLTGLLDRLATLDGKLTVCSPRGEGTKITAELPLT